MTKARTSLAAAFNADARKLAIHRGAQVVDEGIADQLHSTTRYGDMLIWPSTDPQSVLSGLHRDGSFFTVFCRFKTRDRAVLAAAASALGSNPFSGKYNFHHFVPKASATPLVEALRAFEKHLDAIAAV